MKALRAPVSKSPIDGSSNRRAEMALCNQLFRRELDYFGRSSQSLAGYCDDSANVLVLSVDLANRPPSLLTL